ncbi:MAG: hypothetical protein J6W63_01015, partial [Treponema sp.]|nr:hypothetical protein [Treponema sp.]
RPVSKGYTNMEDLSDYIERAYKFVGTDDASDGYIDSLEKWIRLKEVLKTSSNILQDRTDF